MKQFSLYVLPFCIGVVALLVISVWKYSRWIKGMDKKQRATVQKNIWSWRFLPAIWEAIRESLLHWRITKKHFLLGYMHRSLAFGWFLLIVVGAVQAALAYPQGHPFWTAIFFNYFEPRTGISPTFKHAEMMANIMDVLLLYVLSGLLLACVKKIWSRPLGMRRTTRHRLIDRVAKLSLWCIFPLRLLSESVTSSIYHNGGFLVKGIGVAMESIGFDHEAVEYSMWLCYSIALGVFFCLMPFSRYMHIFTEVFLIYFRELGVREGNQKSGYTLFELSACSRCGICIDGCPMNKELGVTNMQGVYMLQSLRNAKDKWPRDGKIGDHSTPLAAHRAQIVEMAENCLMCDRCVAECPVGIDLNTVRRQVRIRNKEEIDRTEGYQYIQNIQTFNAIGRVAYFGGCMSRLTPGITESMQKIFEAVGQKYWYVDKENGICCGRPLLQQGFEHQAAELRRKNSKLIEESRAVALVTSCPICYQSFKKEYRLSIPVIHHTEYIEGLLREGKLKVRNSGEKVAYHDPCELGRGCGIYEEPRRVLRATTHLLKTREEREHSLCCGFNMGNPLIDIEQQTKIRDAAKRNLMESGATTIATACPMCKKAFQRADTVRVKDVAEIVAENME